MLRLLLSALAVVVALPALAQDRRPSHCIALVDKTPGLEVLHKASFRAPLPQHTVRLRYIDHAMFLLQTHGGLSAVTDYVGYIGTADFAPTVATMNRGHDSHWTARPDTNITHVLKGWNPKGGPANHYLDLGEMLVRSVSTDIRSSFGENGIERAANSIFVFEVAGLCIGHLGHLHHEPTPEQFAAIGRLDVVMAPVDGGLTVDTPTMIRILKRFKSSVVIPMHWFSVYSLDEFVAGMKDEFAVEVMDGASYEVSLRTLPKRPTIVVLRPAYLNADD